MRRQESLKPDVTEELSFKAVLLELLQKPDLSIPSIPHMFALMKMAYKKQVDADFSSQWGDVIDVEQARVTNTIGDHSWLTHGVDISVRQKLPVEVNGSSVYLSTFFEWEESTKNKIRVSTCLVVADNEADNGFRREGDLRIDYLHLSSLGMGTFRERIKDGNDDGFGILTGDGDIDGDTFAAALDCAYRLIALEVFGIGSANNIQRGFSRKSRFVLPEAV